MDESAATRLFDTVCRDLDQGRLDGLGLIGAAENLRLDGRPDLAAELYRRGTSYGPALPYLHVVHYNLGMCLDAGGDRAGAIAALRAALAIDSDLHPARLNLGVMLVADGDRATAMEEWREVGRRLSVVNAQNLTYRRIALNYIAFHAEQVDRLGDAVEALGAAYALQPGAGEIGPHWVSMRQELCQWPLLALPGGADRAALLRALMPLTLATYADDPVLHLAAAAAFNRTHVPRGEIRPPVPPRPGPRRKLRIGYLSSDLRGHAVGSMMPRVFELHDRRRFEIVAYYTSARGLDALSLRLHRAADRWVDLAGLDDATAAARIADDAVDILVDLNGYTRDARTAVVALRPAPVIVNWLGYPGTMGSPHHDAIIADDWIIPESHALYYSERVVRLPCYQPNDPTRPRPAPVPGRADLGLPDGAMVYCSFNSPHKLTPFTFARWMQILAQVPGSVLWLYAPGDETRVNLRAAAAAHGIEAGRLVFAERLPNAQHLARFAAADLFLDTAPYGAHTTGSDALWMGLPVLTLSGHSFASRVCGSLVRAAGLPELVTTSPEAYVALAVALGHDRDRLAGLRRRLEAQRDTCVLFDMDGHVRALEAAYRGLWRDWRAGRLPRPDLTNLDAYLEVGAAQDFDAADSVARPDYPAAYRAGLAHLDRYRPLHPDRRLWPGPRTGAPDGPGDPP